MRLLTKLCRTQANSILLVKYGFFLKIKVNDGVRPRIGALLVDPVWIHVPELALPSFEDVPVARFVIVPVGPLQHATVHAVNLWPHAPESGHGLKSGRGEELRLGGGRHEIRCHADAYTGKSIFLHSTEIK